MTAGGSGTRAIDQRDVRSSEIERSREVDPNPTAGGQGIQFGRSSMGVRRSTEVTVAGERIRLPERTAEKISPNDEVSAACGNDKERGLIQEPIEQIRLNGRNVDG